MCLLKLTMTTAIILTGLSCRICAISDILRNHFLKKLYIHVAVPKIPTTLAVCNKIVDLYSSSQKLLPNIDVRIILDGLKNREKRFTSVNKYGVDLLFVSKKYSDTDVSFLRGDNKNLNVIIVDDFEDNESDTLNSTDGPIEIFENVVLGGTFDRLHAGHKILLSEAILRCSKKLTVGVTDTCMLDKKKLWELIEPCDKRIQNVKKFVQDVDGSIECDVVPIQDMYGPTKDDPTFNMIVVSDETLKGGAKVNETRLLNGLQSLEIHCVHLAADTRQSQEEEEKISSSNVRMRLLGTRLKQPKRNVAERPYIIGLTGSIASGKSSIGKSLVSMGAGLVDCDKVAHALYHKGTVIYHQLVAVFGSGIVAPDGEIDRKKLGAIVFSNKAQLDKLNQLLWPEILKESLVQCNKLYQEGKKVVVMEAAVLLRAGWQHSVHEVWTTIIPPHEAVRRLVERNSVDEAAAEARVASQPTNSEQVAIAHVVFCTQWSYEFTHSQVEKAWKLVSYKTDKAAHL